MRPKLRKSDLVKSTLDHLPEGKCRELAIVVNTIREGFDRAISNRSQKRYRHGKLLKIILFGSYARGDWTQDPVGRYWSDFDILVVVDHEDLTEVGEIWLKTEKALLALTCEGSMLRTPVTPIYHSLDDVNEKLARGRYFFMDILTDGIILFEEPGYPFIQPIPLSKDDAVEESNAYYEEWVQSADSFLRGFGYALRDGDLKKAAFDLHQATERLYQCLLLVRTLYVAKTHNLNRLRALCEDIEPALKSVWPASNKDERQAYERLREAYIKARYSREYRISAKHLEWLGQRVAFLREMIRNACTKRIESLKRPA